MRYCRVCQRSMRRDPTSGTVEFKCYCGAAEQGGPEDARIGGASLGAGETVEMYRRMIRGAAHDRVNQLVARHCPGCGRDYMTQIRIGDAEETVYQCKCGDSTGAGAGAGASEAPRA